MSDEPITKAEPTPTSDDLNRQAAIDSLSEGEELAECPACLNMRRAFLIVNGKCDSCRAKDERAVFPAVQLGWPEVRQRRMMLLGATDMTQIEDYPAAKKTAVRGLRQELRDITSKPDPLEAWKEMDRIERDIQLNARNNT